MKNEFFTKATENIEAAELLFENRLYNASANRAYYAGFQAAIAALENIGIKFDRVRHEAVQANFAAELVQKRKIYGNHLKSYLMDLQNVRNFADYKLKFVSKKVAYRQLKKARELVEDVTKEIEK